MAEFERDLGGLATIDIPVPGEDAPTAEVVEVHVQQIPAEMHHFGDHQRRC